jgi:hypothetical protein
VTIVVGGAVINRAADSELSDPYLSALVAAREGRSEGGRGPCSTTETGVDEYCTFGPPSASPLVVLVGDSHAAQWSPAAVEAAASSNAQVFVRTYLWWLSGLRCASAGNGKGNDGGGDDLPQQVALLNSISQHHCVEGDREYGEERRKQAQHSPGVEPAEEKTPVIAVLLEKQRCDQESTENNEDVKPAIPPAKPMRSLWVHITARGEVKYPMRLFTLGELKC